MLSNRLGLLEQIGIILYNHHKRVILNEGGSLMKAATALCRHLAGNPIDWSKAYLQNFSGTIS